MLNPKAAADTSTLTLCAFRAAGLDGAGVSGGKLPERLVVAPWGTHDIRSRGKCIVNDETAGVFGDCQKAMRLDGEVALDFEHNTLPGTPAYQTSQEPRKVAAYGVPVVEKGVGIVLTGLRWTPDGQAAMEGGHFKDLSPAVFRKKDGTVYALHSAGVCRHGEIEGLTIEAAEAAAQLKPLFTALSASLTLSESPDTSPSIMKAALVKLLAALGITIAADAEDAAFETALTDAAGKIEAMVKPKPDAMSAEQSATITALTTRLEKMEAAEITRERRALIDGAVAEGKVIGLSVDMRQTCPLDVLKDHIAQLKPGTVPLSRTSPLGEKGGEHKADALSAEDIAIGQKMGLSEEDLRKGLNLPEAKKAA